MTKPINEFGGWLTFFYVTLWINLAASIIVLLSYFFLMFKANGLVHVIEPLLLFSRAVAVIYFFICMIRTVKDKDPEVPNKILGFMTWYLWVSLAVYLSVVLLEYFALAVDALKIVQEYGRIIFSLILWYAIWSSYLSKSERVLAYYGKNVGSGAANG